MAGIASLLCPRCKVPLNDVRTSDGVFYRCDVCGGRAVTIELLRKRFTPEYDAHEVEMLLPANRIRALPNSRKKRARCSRSPKSSIWAKQAEGPDLDSAAPRESWKEVPAFLGMPVEFDAPEEQRRPWATWLLSVVIVCASLEKRTTKSE